MHDDPLIAVRLRQVLAHTELNQRQLAQRLGLSDGFVSQVARGLKRPGTEFFFALRRELGVSIDWLLTGEGSMFGSVGIRQDLLHAIRLQVATVRAAIVDKNPDAKELLTLIAEDRLHEGGGDVRFQALLDRISPADPDGDLAVMLYNGHQWASDPVAQRRNLLASAIAHFEGLRKEDKLSALWGSPRSKPSARKPVTG